MSGYVGKMGVGSEHKGNRCEGCVGVAGVMGVLG